MKKTILSLAIILGLFACEKQDTLTEACITNCNSSTPGKINIAVEDHTGQPISNLSMEINGTTVLFDLFSKSNQGNYSCWKAFDKIELISGIQFKIGNNALHQEFVDYKNLARTREYTIDISSTPEGIKVQLVADPGCVSDAD